MRACSCSRVSRQDSTDVDVAIRFGDGNYPGLAVDQHFHGILFPVCGPALLKGRKPLRKPHGLHFSQTSLAVQAAIDGHGVAPLAIRRSSPPRIA